FVPIGSPESDAPIGVAAPLSRPFGPELRAGEPGSKLNQSRITCACSQVVKKVSATCGTYLKSGSFVELPPPGPDHANGIRLLLNVTTEFVRLRTSFSAS